MNQEIVRAMADLNDDEVLGLVRKELEAEVPASEILAALQEGIRVVGERFASGEYFIPHLMISGDLLKQAQELLAGALGGEKNEYIATVVLGTVKNDIHDIGKNIVKSVLEAHGFEVIDVGVDAEPSAFVQAIQESDSKLVGMSCLLTTAFPSLKETVEAIDVAGLHEGRLLMIGGGPLDQTTLAYCGADVYCRTPQDAIKVCKDFLSV
jgi:methylmalonyl-CoA mutase cobalamin-binding domain/chain